MTSTALKRIINQLNKNKTELIHIRPLSENVDFAKVWNKKPKPTDDIVRPDGAEKFYFIKEPNGVYVASVCDMNDDLHWFVLPKYRGKGYLTNAMKDIILPHLFQDREEQRITITKEEIGAKNFMASKRVALKLGFIHKRDNEYYLTSSNNLPHDVIDGENTKISEARYNELRKCINYLGRSLWMIQTEIEMKHGVSENTEELRELVDMVRSHIQKFDDDWWSNQNI